MHRFRRFILPLILLLAIIVLGGAGYMRASKPWQESYRQGVSEGLVKLLQENPYDQIAVVVIVIDGLRWEEGIGSDDHEFIPHIWNDLRPLGTLLTNYQIVSPTVTTSSHTAMLTGRISTVPNDGHIRPVFPTFLEYFRDARSDYIESAISEIIKPPAGFLRPDAHSRLEVEKLVADAREFGSDKTACYFGKDLICSLDQSSCGRYPDDDVFLIDSLRDIEVTEYFLAKIPDVRPNMVVVNLGDVDECGHEAEWHYYADSIRWADRHVWEMWEALQAETRYRDKTYFIITTDHGRHIPDRGGYVHHGCFCEGCQHAFMLLIGPGIKRDYVSDELHSELDLAPTIGNAVGFATPGCSGEPMMEIFENPGNLPDQRETESTALVESDRENVDERDTAAILLDNIVENMDNHPLEENTDTAIFLMAVAARIHTHPDEVDKWESVISSITPDADQPVKPDNPATIYPLILCRNEIATAREQVSVNIGVGFEKITEALNARNSDGDGQSDTFSLEGIALIAPMIAIAGAINDNSDMTRDSYQLLLNELEKYEGKERVRDGGLENFIDDFRYREGPNLIFTEKDLSMRDRMWLIWSIERVLAESNPDHVPDLYPLLRRQYRLLIAFTHEWQDANAMVGGTGDLGEEIDLVAQGLSLASLAEFKPWRKWELDELGYSMDVYRTPLFSWPPHHFFYILGQANALAGGCAANERLMLYVNDDGSIRHDLLDSAPPLKPTDPDYILNAAALAYGLSRFELADYNLYDLEMYPIIHQQD